MSDAVQNPEEPAVQEPTLEQEPTVEGLSEKSNAIKEMEAELDRLRKHNETLLGEKKSTKKKAQELEEMSRKLQEEKAKRDGDYEALLKAREAEKEKVEEQLTSLQKAVTDKERAFAAAKLSSQLRVDEDAGEILERFAMDRISYEDNQIVILDKQGNPTTQTVEDLVEDFKTDPRFKNLIKGSGASGGGAAGSNLASNSVTQQNADSARQKGDLNGFLKHSLSGVI